MTPSWAVAALAGTLAPALLLTGCRSCNQAESLAEIVTVQGTVWRDFASHPQGWSAAGVGATLAVGDGLRTEKGATARVRLRHGGVLDVREETLLRFLAAAPSAERRVSLETGIAELEMGDEGLEFETRFGAARIEPGAHVRLSADGERTRLEVIVGSAIVEGEDASASRLDPGQTIVFGEQDGGAAAASRTGNDAGVDAGDAGPADTAAAVDDPSAITAIVGDPGVQRTNAGSTRLEPVSPGTARLDPGSRLVVPAGAKVAVRRGDEHATVFGPSDVRVGTPGGAFIEARTGRMTVDDAHTSIRIDVPGGTITIRGTGAETASADLVLGKHTTDVFARAGTTELHGRRSNVTLAAHQAARLDEGGFAEPSLAAVGPPLLTIPAGESSTIHSLVIPMAVKLDVGAACSAGGSRPYAEMARGGRYLPAGVADAVEDAIVIYLSEGAQAYRVRCQDAPAAPPVASGSLRVLRDAGITRLPKTPPHDVIHADGRRYSVLYQNLLPALTVDWPDAPSGDAFVLKLRSSKDHIDATPTTAASLSLASGKLADGTYGFWFESARDPRLRSLETGVRIVFDNAAPAAEIHEPADGFDPKDGAIEVVGVAVEGVTVSVAQTPIPLDAQYRFRGEVPVPAGDHAIAIRIAHPTRGVQYYLRRTGGS